MYSSHHIHETILRDAVRTESYERAIMSNPALFKNATVLNVGCGTGVLLIFTARCGAKKNHCGRYSNVVEECKSISRLNGYGEVIHCVRGELEDLIEAKTLPLEDGETVNVVISEWMGYALLFETMLPSVMIARYTSMMPPPNK